MRNVHKQQRNRSKSVMKKSFNVTLGSSYFSANLQLNRCYTSKCLYRKNIQKQNSKKRYNSAYRHCDKPPANVTETLLPFPKQRPEQTEADRERIEAWRERGEI